MRNPNRTEAAVPSPTVNEVERSSSSPRAPPSSPLPSIQLLTQSYVIEVRIRNSQRLFVDKDKRSDHEYLYLIPWSSDDKRGVAYK